jgi:DNA methylase
VYAAVARPPALCRWGTLPGAYVGKPDIPGKLCTGGKPLWAMRALVRDYSRPGDLICDPCAGAATTLLAAAIEGRRAIGAEVDAATWRTGSERLALGFTPSLFVGLDPPREPAQQIALDLVEMPP